MQITVRRANEGDLDWVLPQARAFAQFYDSKHSLYMSDEYTRGYFSQLVEKHLFLIADSDLHGPIGFIAGWVSPQPYNPSLTALTEQFWWVAEEHRGSRAGLMLLNEFTAWGKAHCQQVWMTLEDKSPIADRSLSKRGYRLKERNYLLEVV